MGKNALNTNRNRKLRPFLRRVRNLMPDARFILFGSQSRGTARPDSDFDLLVVSDSFSNIGFYERHVQIYSLMDGKVSVDAICLTPAELEARSSELSTVGIAARRGVPIEP